jgi:NTE family protein
MQAFVLSGGSVLGAFQAGAICQVLQDGFAPQAIFGVSVGALNGAFLADRAGQQLSKGKQVSWKSIGDELVAFWVDNITGPSAIIEQNSDAKLLFDIIFTEFDGLVGTAHLKTIINQAIKAEHLQQYYDNGFIFQAGTVDMISGEIVYADVNTYGKNIIGYIYASTAIPISMPIVPMRGQLYIDGGIRHVAPVRDAIKNGATDIVCIVCQSPSVATLKPLSLVKIL